MDSATIYCEIETGRIPEDWKCDESSKRGEE